jgi:hypothetical protein
VKNDWESHFRLNTTIDPRLAILPDSEFAIALALFPSTSPRRRKRTTAIWHAAQFLSQQSIMRWLRIDLMFFPKRYRRAAPLRKALVAQRQRQGCSRQSHERRCRKQSERRLAQGIPVRILTGWESVVIGRSGRLVPMVRSYSAGEYRI